MSKNNHLKTYYSTENKTINTAPTMHKEILSGGEDEFIAEGYGPKVIYPLGSGTIEITDAAGTMLTYPVLQAVPILFIGKKIKAVDVDLNVQW